MQIVFLGRLAEQFGESRDLDLGHDQTVADAILACAEDRGELLLAPGISYVLDHQIVGLQQPVGDAKELAFLPPVSGG